MSHNVDWSPCARRRARLAGAAALGLGLAIGGCSSSAPAVPTAPPVSLAPPAPPAPPASLAPRGPGDCRASTCPIGETCSTDGTCGSIWKCTGCSTAVVQEPAFFCSCDGKTIQTTHIGCGAFEYKHSGPCH